MGLLDNLYSDGSPVDVGAILKLLGAGQNPNIRAQSSPTPGAPTASNDPFAASFLTAGPAPGGPASAFPEPLMTPREAAGGAPGGPLLPPTGGTSLPPNATPTASTTPLPGMTPPAPSLLDRVMGGVSSNSNMLLALAGGLGGARTWGEGIGRAAQLAIPASQLDIKQQAMNQTVNALVKQGKIAPDMAALIATNPAALQQILPQILGVKNFTPEKLKGPLGEDIPAVFNRATGSWYGADGKQIGAGGATGQVSLLAPGVKSIDSTLQGYDYLNQFSPEVQSAVKAYMSGGVMPTGNPRNQTIATQAKMIAQKVANDLGEPLLADDALYPARRKMQVDLASSSNSSMGGILSNGKSAFDHLANLSDKFAALGNVNVGEFPGSGHIATGVNIATNAILPSTATNAKVAAVNDNALKYGQEATKFYAGSGGGEAERMNALKQTNPRTTTGAEQAAFLETEKGLMLDRLREKENQIRSTLGEQYLNAHPVMTPELQKNIDRIDKNIAFLRGASPAPTVPTEAPAAAGWTDLGGGVRIRLKP